MTKNRFLYFVIFLILIFVGIEKDDDIKKCLKKETCSCENQQQKTSNSIIENKGKILDEIEKSKELTREEKILELKSKFNMIAENVFYSSSFLKILKNYVNLSVLDEKNRPIKNPSPYNNNTTIELIKGKGREVSCGQKVKINYKLYSLSGNMIYSSYDNNPVEFTIGNLAINKDIQNSIVGMKPGEVRKFLTLPEFNYQLSSAKNIIEIPEKEYVFLEVELIEASSARNFEKVKIFQDNWYYDNDLKSCGDEVSIKIKISKLNGEVLYNNEQPVKFKLGDPLKPALLTKIADGIAKVGKRTILVPTELFPNDYFFLDKEKLKNQEMILIEIEY